VYIDNSYGLKAIPDGYKQIFQNKFTSNISKNQILKMKEENVLTDRDLEIAIFLFEFRFATLEQIYQYLKLKGILTQKKVVENEEVRETSINSIKGRLDKLVINRVLNKFSLSLYNTDKIQSDSLIFYCLDLGGKFLLSHYSNKDVYDWYTSVNLKTSSLISKDIAATQFYLKLLEQSNDKLKYFITYPLRKFNKTSIVPTFEFCLMNNGMPNYFLVEVVRDCDVILEFPQKVEKLEMLLNTNSWKKYYYGNNNPPILFILAENDLVALDVGRVIANTTSIDRFRITTDEKINGNLTTAFMKYLKEEDMLKLMKLNIF